MSSHDNDTNINKDKDKDNDIVNDPILVEDKIGELLLQGWTLLADSCFNENCRIPLVRDSLTNQIYCVGCEAWVFYNERTTKKLKFTALVALGNRRDDDIDESKGKEVCTKTVPIEITCPSFKTILENKMFELVELLKKEKEPSNCVSQLDAIKKIYDLIKVGSI